MNKLIIIILFLLVGNTQAEAQHPPNRDPIPVYFGTYKEYFEWRKPIDIKSDNSESKNIQFLTEELYNERRDLFITLKELDRDSIVDSTSLYSIIFIEEESSSHSSTSRNSRSYKLYKDTNKVYIRNLLQNPTYQKVKLFSYGQEYINVRLYNIYVGNSSWWGERKYYLKKVKNDD